MRRPTVISNKGGQGGGALYALIDGASDAQRGPGLSRPIWHLLCRNSILVALRDKFGRSRNTSCAPRFVFDAADRYLLVRSKYCHLNVFIDKEDCFGELMRHVIEKLLLLILFLLYHNVHRWKVSEIQILYNFEVSFGRTSAQ